MYGSPNPSHVGISQATQIIAYLRCRQINAGEVDTLQLLSLHFQKSTGMISIWQLVQLAIFEKLFIVKKKPEVIIVPINDGNTQTISIHNQRLRI